MILKGVPKCTKIVFKRKTYPERSHFKPPGSPGAAIFTRTSQKQRKPLKLNENKWPEHRPYHRVGGRVADPRP